MKAFVIIACACALASVAVASDIEVEWNGSSFDLEGRRTDITELRNDADEERDFTVGTQRGQTRARIPAGGGATVVVPPAGEPIIILRDR